MTIGDGSVVLPVYKSLYEKERYEIVTRSQDIRNRQSTLRPFTAAIIIIITTPHVSCCCFDLINPRESEVDIEIGPQVMILSKHRVYACIFHTARDVSTGF